MQIPVNSRKTENTKLNYVHLINLMECLNFLLLLLN